MTRWLTPEEVSERTGITPVNLKKMRYRRIGLPFYKPTSKTVLYDEAEVDAYVRSTLVEPSAPRK